MIRVELDGMLVSSQSFLVSLKFIENSAFSAMGTGRAGVKLYSLHQGYKRLLVSPQLVEGNAFVDVGESIVGVESNGVLQGYKCLLVPLEFDESSTLVG